jgi:formyl-CoA transferase
VGRAVDLVRIGAMIDGQRGAVDRPPPVLGADSAAVLADLGYDRDEIARMRAEGVI